MELKKQVCSLEFAMRLKELGVKQESVFLWDTIVRWDRPYPYLRLNQFDAPADGHISAFTVAELGEILPRGFSSGRPFGKDLFECWPTFDSAPSGEIIKEQEKYLKVPLDCELTEADARAKMLIYLIENKLINISCAPVHIPV